MLGRAVHGLGRIEQDILVGTGAVGAPHLLAGVEIVGRDVAANAVLSSRDAHEDLVLDHQRSTRHRLPQLRIAVLGHPQDLAGLGVKRVDLRVQGIRDDFPVRISDAAVHHVAAGDGRRQLVYLRSELPGDAPELIEVDGIDVVGIRALQVHHVADHQRLTLLASKRAQRHRPGHLEPRHILSGDLVEFTVASPGIVPKRHDPLVGVLGHRVQ